MNATPFFYPNAKQTLAWAGNTPGLPWPFQYVEVPVHTTYVNPEYLPAFYVPPYAGIRQYQAYSNPIIGDFHSLVYDVPFNSVARDRTNAPPSISPMFFMD